VMCAFSACLTIPPRQRETSSSVNLALVRSLRKHFSFVQSVFVHSEEFGPEERMCGVGSLFALFAVGHALRFGQIRTSYTFTTTLRHMCTIYRQTISNIPELERQ
jgi:hypothetical protein